MEQSYEQESLKDVVQAGMGEHVIFCYKCSLLISSFKERASLFQRPQNNRDLAIGKASLSEMY
jgi:hypothetical protein